MKFKINNKKTPENNKEQIKRRLNFHNYVNRILEHL